MTDKEVIDRFVTKVKKYYSAPRYMGRREPAHTLVSHLFWVLDGLAAEDITNEEVDLVDLKPRTPAEYDKLMEEFNSCFK